MRTHIAQRIQRVHWHEIFYDRRFWGIAAIAGFVVLCTALVVISVQSGSSGPFPSYPYVWPYGPYGPMPVP